MSWVSVDEKLPELRDDDFGLLSSDSCLVFVAKWGTMFTAILKKCDGEDPYWVQFGRDGYRSEEVTHWMHLPLPPITQGKS